MIDGIVVCAKKGVGAGKNVGSGWHCSEANLEVAILGGSSSSLELISLKFHPEQLHLAPQPL